MALNIISFVLRIKEWQLLQRYHFVWPSRVHPFSWSSAQKTVQGCFHSACLTYRRVFNYFEYIDFIELFLVKSKKSFSSHRHYYFSVTHLSWIGRGGLFSLSVWSSYTGILLFSFFIWEFSSNMAKGTLAFAGVSENRWAWSFKKKVE